MLLQNNPDRIRIVFDDHCLVANAACSCQPPSPRAWAYKNSSTITSTSQARRGGRTEGKRC